MARVHNWQIGREMSYWYPESRPKEQFAAVFDINKCIACQTCTLACKTTWTSGKGQEYMLWNNVETKPYGFYPLAWDVQAAREARARRRGKTARTKAARSSRRPRPASACSAGVPRSSTTPTRTSAKTTAPATVEHGADMQMPHVNWFFYLARICNHCTYPGVSRVVPARLDLQAAGRRHRAASIRGAAAATRSASRPARTRRSSSIR